MMTDTFDGTILSPDGWDAAPEFSEEFVALVESFYAIWNSDGRVEPGSRVNPADAYFAYRTMLGRSPDKRLELPGILANPQTNRELMKAILASPEFAHTGGYFPYGKFLMGEVEGFRFWFNTADVEMGVRMALGT